MTTPYTTGTITLTNGSAVVEGDGTAWELALITGGVLYHDGRALPIESVESDTSLTLAIAWPEATVAAAAYAIVRDTDLAQQSVENAIALSALIKELQSATWFQYNAAGDLAGRDGYDNRGKGFVYLDISATPFEMYIKASNDEGDWAGPNRYAQGEQGVVGPAGPFGPPGIDWKGTYSGATAYLERDAVRDNGSTWIALQDTTGNAPPVYPATENDYWELLAVKGLDGTGTGDVVGPVSSPDGGFVVFDGTTGKLIKNVDAATMKAALSILAADVGFDNTTADLDGDPETVQAAIEAIVEMISESSAGAGMNDAVFALEIADLKGARLGMVGGIADAFDDETGVDAASSTNEAYSSSNDWYAATALTPPTLYGPGGGAGGAAWFSSGAIGTGKTPSGFGGGGGSGAGQNSTVGGGAGAAGAPGLIVVQYTTTGGVAKTLVLTSGTSWEVPADWNSANNSIETIGAGGAGGAGGSGGNGSYGGSSGGGGAYSKITNLALTPGASVTYQVGAAAVSTNGGDTWFNGANLGASSVGAKGGTRGTDGVSPTVPGTSGVGGAAASGIGTTKYSGGNGATPATAAGVGGGGAAGPNGNGGNGINIAGGSGGGGGGANGGSNATTGAGGHGRGGSGGGAAGRPGGAGTAGTGGGGGGATTAADTATNLTGGAGAQEDIWTVPGTPNNMTLISAAYTAASVPSTGRIAVQLVETDTITINTDVTAEISRDNGTTWSAVTLALTSNLIGPAKVYEGTVSVAGQPSGSSMRWRVKTLNNKNVAISGVVFQWS